MFRSRNASRWALAGVIALAAALFVPGAYRNLAADKEATYQGLKVFSDVIDIVERDYVDEVAPKTLIENAIQGMVSSLDPHSSLLTPDALKELQIDTQGEFTGIGIHVTMRNNLVTVISPIEGTPAYRAGIKAGDKIIKVDNTPTDNLTDAVKRMRGPKGTNVKVTIIREGELKPIDFDLVRDVIPIQSVKSVVLQPGYGYVWVTHFRENTYEDLVAALETMEKADPPMKGLVLDLRDNPGGVLNQAIDISDLFLDDGLIMTSKGRLERHTKEYKATKSSVSRTYPIVALINGGSASASEIVAGALQDRKRALILGTTSFGKGSVQAIENLRDGYALKLTIARYYTPNGRSIQAKGVEPDIIVPQGIVPDQITEKDRLFKEKDLANHLDAESDEQTVEEEQTDAEEPKTKGKPGKIKSRLSPLDANQLMQDRQVRRALDILVSYEIFKTLKNG
ncbi:MAG: S41 family peptidase [Desulfatitalea sp.]|nr:S41 family peptidase [Desulfatitalea sp.]NNJ98968.1 S41 family peptidase [Desulfatitalea sp.]